MTTHYSKGPVVRTEVLKLWEHVDTANGRVLMPFEREILWVRESHTRFVLRLDEFDIDERGQFSDYYGFMRSLTDAITDDAARLGRHLKLREGERFAAELDVTITDTPLLRVKEPAHFGSIAYESLYGKNWCTSDVPEKVWDSGFKQYPALDAVEVANVKSIYSTRRHPIGVIPEDVAAWITDQNALTTAKAVFK